MKSSRSSSPASDDESAHESRKRIVSAATKTTLATRTSWFFWYRVHLRSSIAEAIYPPLAVSPCPPPFPVRMLEASSDRLARSRHTERDKRLTCRASPRLAFCSKRLVNRQSLAVESPPPPRGVRPAAATRPVPAPRRAHLPSTCLPCPAAEPRAATVPPRPRPRDVWRGRNSDQPSVYGLVWLALEVPHAHKPRKKSCMHGVLNEVYL